jgi:hypothetical protein
MADQDATTTWTAVSSDFAWARLEIPPPPDRLPPGTESGLFEFAFSRILLVRYKSDSEIGAELNRDLFGVVRREIRSFPIPDDYTAIELRTNAHYPTNPVRRSRMLIANDTDRKIVVVDHKNHKDQ